MKLRTSFAVLGKAWQKVQHRAYAQDVAVRPGRGSTRRTWQYVQEVAVRA